MYLYTHMIHWGTKQPSQEYSKVVEHVHMFFCRTAYATTHFRGVMDFSDKQKECTIGFKCLYIMIVCITLFLQHNGIFRVISCTATSHCSGVHLYTTVFGTTNVWAVTISEVSGLQKSLHQVRLFCKVFVKACYGTWHINEFQKGT